MSTAESPCAFLENQNIIQSVNAILDTTHETDDISIEQYNLVIGFLAAKIIYTNAQRPGVVQYMEIEEFEAKTKEGLMFVIHISHHKTATSHGPARVVINETTCEMLRKYYSHFRTRMVAKNEEFAKRFFLSASGSEFRKITETLQQLALKYNVSLPTPTTYRKVIETAAQRELPADRAASIQKHMSHSTATCERYYQFPAISDAIATQNDILELATGKHFTQEMDKQILKEWPLHNNEIPPLTTCGVISEMYNMKKTAQQIQERWKTLTNCKRIKT